MGYELHIYRKRNWEDDNESSDISLDEWLDYIKTDLELNLRNRFKIEIPGIINRYQEDPVYCIWKGHSCKTEEGKPWLAYNVFDNSIHTKYPDDETIKKMIFIAKSLNGRVQGDDGEFYDDDYFLKDINNEVKSFSHVISKPWWKFW